MCSFTNLFVYTFICAIYRYHFVKTKKGLPAGVGLVTNTPNQVTNDHSSIYLILIFEFSYIANISFIINKFSRRPKPGNK